MLDKETYEALNCIKEITDNFNKEYDTSFKRVFAVNVFPQIAFIYDPDKKSLKIATYYIIGYDDINDKINIFQSIGGIFKTQHYGNRGLSKQIEKYNNNATNYKIGDIPQICEHYAPIFR